MNLMRDFDFCQRFTHYYLKWHASTLDAQTHESQQLKLPLSKEMGNLN